MTYPLCVSSLVTVRSAPSQLSVSRIWMCTRSIQCCVSKARHYRARVEPPSADIILFSRASVPALQRETDIVRQQTELEDRNPSCWLVAQKLSVLELHRMLAFSGAFTSVLLCQLIGFRKWEHIDQEKSIASQLGCPFIETSSRNP